MAKADLPPRKAHFQLEEPLRFRSDIADGDIIVPRGYISDLASIPRFAWSIFMSPDDPRIALGAWIHDLLYQQHGMIAVDGVHPTMMSREQADKILCYEAMPDLGATKLQQHTVYWMLRIFGDRWK